jgi:DNA repair protein RadC
VTRVIRTPGSGAPRGGARARETALAPGDGPRERLDALGPEALSDAELIALLLRTGGGGHDALALAARLLHRHDGLPGLAAAAAGELAREDGMGPVKSATLVAALELGRRFGARRLRSGDPVRGPADVFRHFHPRLRDARHERFLLVLLDGRHRMLRDVVISQGTLTASLVHPREVFRPALREAAAAVVLVHNHPSGDPTPSREDREITERLVAAGDLLGIPVLDHVVVAERGYASLREAGVIGAPGPSPEDGAL